MWCEVCDGGMCHVGREPLSDFRAQARVNAHSRRSFACVILGAMATRVLYA